MEADQFAERAALAVSAARSAGVADAPLRRLRPSLTPVVAAPSPVSPPFAPTETLVTTFPATRSARKRREPVFQTIKFLRDLKEPVTFTVYDQPTTIVP